MENFDREEIEGKINSLLEMQIRPILQRDGGDIVFRSFSDDGVLEVELTGACHGCPHAQQTLKRVVEDTLKYFVPEISSVKNVVAE